MKYLLLFLNLCLVISNGIAADKTVIRAGVQASGTLAWELSVLENGERYKNLDFRLETQALANPEAGKIALQSGSVDMIVSDWVWVSRMRADGADFTFYPYSTNSGALMVPEKSNINKLADLKGKKLGIAGGEIDKNWLLLQALAKQQNLDLNTLVEKVFGAPPLIDEQLKEGRIDAALNYWHFAAKLEGQGFRSLINGKEIMAALGVKESVPALGYVFRQSWAKAHKTVLPSFIAAARQAKLEICNSDAVWLQVVPLTHAEDKASQTRLRQYYCDGEVKQWGNAEQQAAERIYSLLKEVSDNKLTGKSEHIQSGTFWTFE
jgi:NitT/TauT family transport system substrate-binding protein